MKNFFEVFMSTMILMLTVLIVITLFTIETTIIEARNLHASAVQRVEILSDTKDTTIKEAEDAFNEQLKRLHPNITQHDGWYVTFNRMNKVGYRQTFKVSLHYIYVIPLFNLVEEGMIEGYAR